MRSWVGVLGSRRVFQAVKVLVVVASAQAGEVVRAGGAGGVGDDVVAVEVFGAGVAAGESAGEVAGFDGVADVVGDAVFDGCHGGELAGDRVGDQPPPAGIGTGAQVAGDLRADRSEAFGFGGQSLSPISASALITTSTVTSTRVCRSRNPTRASVWRWVAVRASPCW